MVPYGALIRFKLVPVEDSTLKFCSVQAFICDIQNNQVCNFNAGKGEDYY